MAAGAAAVLYSPVEGNIIAHINDRLDTWHDIIAAHIAYFGDYTEACRQSALVYKRMAATLSRRRSVHHLAGSGPLTSPIARGSDQQAASAPEGTSPAVAGGGRRNHTWLGPLQVHALNVGTSDETFHQYVGESVLPHLAEISEDYKKKSAILRGRLVEASKRLVKRHQVLLVAIDALQRGWSERIALCSFIPTADGSSFSSGAGQRRSPDRLSGGGDEVRLCGAEQQTAPPAESGGSARTSAATEGIDIFLLEQVLRHRIAFFLQEKSVFTRTLEEVFEQTRVLEHTMATAIRDIVSDAMIVRAKQFVAASEIVSDCADGIRASDSLAEWNESIQRHRLDWSWSLAPVPADGFLGAIMSHIRIFLTPNGHPSEDGARSAIEGGHFVRPITVSRAGFLMRPSTFGRSWNVVFCILANSQHLHCYDATVARKKFDGTSSGSRSASPSASPTHQERPYRIPDAKMRPHGKALSELNTHACKAFFEGDPIKLAHPLLSIPLMHGGVTISTGSGEGGGASASLSVLTIRIPGEAGFFGRGERTYTLAAFSEEDMVDWCIALKEQLAVPTAACSQVRLPGGVAAPRPSSVPNATIGGDRRPDVAAEFRSTSSNAVCDAWQSEEGMPVDEHEYVFSSSAYSSSPPPLSLGSAASLSGFGLGRSLGPPTTLAVEVDCSQPFAAVQADVRASEDGEGASEEPSPSVALENPWD